MTDWPALAARFDAADEPALFDLVCILAERIWLRAEPFEPAKTDAIFAAIEDAEAVGMPILLLGVVAACVPEGWRAGVIPAQVGDFGSVVCRAWDEVERAGGSQ